MNTNEFMPIGEPVFSAAEEAAMERIFAAPIQSRGRLHWTIRLRLWLRRFWA